MLLALEGLYYSLQHLVCSIQLAQHQDFKSNLKINLIQIRFIMSQATAHLPKKAPSIIDKRILRGEIELR